MTQIYSFPEPILSGIKVAEIAAFMRRRDKVVSDTIWTSLRGPLNPDVHGLNAGLENRTTIRKTTRPKSLEDMLT